MKRPTTEPIDPTRTLHPTDDPEATAETARAESSIDTDDGTDGPWGASRLYGLEERFDDLGLIGMGGMGEVRRVRDRGLDRVLALKLLRADRIDQREAHARFVEEARVNARLQHPGIVAVHEQGTLLDGRPWFTMKEVRGRTLDEAIEALHAEPHPSSALRRMAAIFVQLCRTVAYAHSNGVVHRDLKPHNVMLGEFGEVLILDWGIARVERTREATHDTDGPDLPEPADPSETIPTRAETRAGRILGTPAYMSPEQAAGEAIGPPTDVYAIGAMLYRLLTGRAPYRGSMMRILFALGNEPPPPIAEVRSPDLEPAPDALVELCGLAMNRAWAERPTASALADRLEGWLDGARKRSRAREIVAEADAMLPEIERLRAQSVRVRAEARAMLDGLPSHAPIDEKRPGWRLEDEAESQENEARLLEVRMLQTLRAALNIERELPEAHARLARHYQGRLLDAERAGDAAEAAIFEELVRSHDRGGLAGWLRGDGALTLVTDPPGARVTHFRYETRDRRLVEVEVGVIGYTPLRSHPLPRGSHLMVIEAEGCHPVRYPVWIERESHWDGIPPDETEPYAIALPPQGTLGPDEVYVPAGWAIVGGDPDALEALPAHRRWVDGFIAARHPVCNADYLGFLDDMDQRGVDTRRWWPTDHVAGTRPTALVARGPDGRLMLTARDALGRPWAPRWPVVQIDHPSALAYARWRAERTGLPWRLPHAVEWLKAARGVDGRPLPWGNHLEPTRANISGSQPGPPGLGPVGAFPDDRGPHGMGDAAGNVREWCLNPFEKTAGAGRLTIAAPEPRDEVLFEVRGGGFTSQRGLARLATRFAAPAPSRFNVLGFRVARSWPAAPQDS